jgi:hypothetical protein
MRSSSDAPAPSAVSGGGPLLPDYAGACLSNLVPGILAGPGGRPSWFPALARDAAQVVLLVVDGMGWEQLRERPGVAPTLASMIGGPITSVAPTTTATALTSITLGVAPALHGLVGYRFPIPVAGPDGPSEEILNVLRWRSPSGDARRGFPPEQAVEGLAFGGRPVPVVSRAEFAETGFSRAHQRGGRYVGYSLASSIAVEVGRLLAAGESLVYAYYEGLDKVAHLTGLGEHFDAELRATDRLVADLLEVLPPGAVLLVTADHGEVEVGDRVVPLAEELRSLCSLVSGEARFRWLHAHPGSAPDLLAACSEAYDREAWVVTADEVVDQGWFGGPLRPEFRPRIGDVALVPYAPVGYLDPADTGDVRLVCRHGSLTPAELLVPLLAGVGPHP